MHICVVTNASADQDAIVVAKLVDVIAAKKLKIACAAVKGDVIVEKIHKIAIVQKSN